MSHGQQICMCVLWLFRSIVPFPRIKMIVLLHNELVYIIIFASNVFILIKHLHLNFFNVVHWVNERQKYTNCYLEWSLILTFKTQI